VQYVPVMGLDGNPSMMALFGGMQGMQMGLPPVGRAGSRAGGHWFALHARRMAGRLAAALQLAGLRACEGSSAIQLEAGPLWKQLARNLACPWPVACHAIALTF
jgi:hypothetical protein